MVSIEVHGASTLAEHRQRFVSGDRQQPRREFRPPLKAIGEAPDIEEGFYQKILGQRFILDQAQNEPEGLLAVASKQDVHGDLVALRQPSQQHLVIARYSRPGRRTRRIGFSAGNQICAEHGGVPLFAWCNSMPRRKFQCWFRPKRGIVDASNMVR
jgi:hypothetical protein